MTPAPDTRRDAPARPDASHAAGEYVYGWGNNPRRAELKGRRCRIVTRGRGATVLIEMTDTRERVTTSVRALRRAG